MTSNADSGRVIGKPTPVLIQWWRCGKAHAGKGWTTCKTPEACSRDGCVKVSPTTSSERDSHQDTTRLPFAKPRWAEE